MNKLISFTLIALTLSACGVLWEYRSIHELKDMTWSASDIQSFDFEIKEEGNYEVVIMIRHLHGLSLQTIPVQLAINNGTILLNQDYDIPIRDEAGEYLGEGGGDLWDVDYTATQSQKLIAGKYQATISQISGHDELKLIMEVGLMIKKAE